MRLLLSFSTEGRSKRLGTDPEAEARKMFLQRESSPARPWSRDGDFAGKGPASPRAPLQLLAREEELRRVAKARRSRQRRRRPSPVTDHRARPARSSANPATVAHH